MLNILRIQLILINRQIIMIRKKLLYGIIIFESIFLICCGNERYDYSSLNIANNIALNNEEIFIGSCCNDNPAGIINILEKENNKWYQKQVIEMKDVASQYRGPITFAVNEKFLVVGLDNKQNKPGAVLIITKINDNWEKAYIINSPLCQKDDLFGFSIALYKNQLIVGAKNGKDGKKKTGKAYLYELQENSYKLLNVFNNPDIDNVSFGSSVSINDKNIVIADYNYNNLNNNNAELGSKGKIYIYDFLNYELCETISDNEVHKEFNSIQRIGSSLHLEENFLVLGAADQKRYIYELNIPKKNQINNLLSFSFQEFTNYKDLFYIDGVFFKLINEKIVQLTNKCSFIDCGLKFEDVLMSESQFLRIYYFYDEKLHKIVQRKIQIYRILPDFSLESEGIITHRTLENGIIEFYNVE